MPDRAIIKTFKKRAKIAIRHIGWEIAIKRKHNTAPVNDFGKRDNEDEIWETVGEEYAYRAYGSQNEEPNRRRTTGGRVRMDDPNVLLEVDTAAQEGDRLEFPDGETYEIDRIFERGAHTETQVTRVQQ